MLEKRVISALVALPLLFLAVLLSLKVFYIAVFIITAIGLYEYFSAANKGNIKPMKNTGIIFGLVLLFLIISQNTQNIIIPAITLSVLIFLSVPIFDRRYSFIGAGITIIGVLYVPLLFGYLCLLRAIPDKGVYLIWFVFIVSWISDTFAYFTGRLFGKTKLCPEVSPKKTVEGAIGGIIFSIIVCVIYGIILNSHALINMPLIHLVVMGALGSIVSMLGDLAASSIKRNVGIKDYGNIMPGHGGVLDRFDSILFAAPLIYYYITYFI